jgi:carboxyl-terminal processing protease
MNDHRNAWLDQNWVFVILVVGSVILSMAIGFLAGRFFFPGKDNLGLVLEARSLIIENSIFEIPESSTLEYGMIRGMLNSLNDPYTYFNEPDVAEVQSNDLTGSYGGIGVRLERDMNSDWRIYPLPDSPALSAGLQDGDLLIRVNDLIVTPDVDQVTIIAQLRGPLEDDVDIEVLRGAQTLSFVIQRQTLSLPSVTFNLVPDAPQIGLVQINRIAASTTSEIEEALKALSQKGAQAFILDLRDNSGGLVETGIEISRLFLERGEIIHQQFKGEELKIFSVKEPGLYSASPLVIFVNENTASTAEIIAGALSSNQRAVLIGKPTYGKTTIQLVFTLQDGSSIHVTSGRWWIPGIEYPLIPDVAITDDPMGTAFFEKAIDILSPTIND